jgi:precorrin-3B synthase
MNPSLRRNACPTIANPMETGDGLLARLPPAAPLSPESLRAVCDAAKRFGNGTVEITARGSIQVRGLTTATTPPFVKALAGTGIADARPAILAPPLAGLDPGEIDEVRPLVGELRDAVDAEGLGPRLAPKTSVVIDGGGGLHLDAVDADLRLIATGESRFTLALGGTAATAHPVGAVSADHAVAAALIVLRTIADAGPSTRGRDLDPAAVAAAIGTQSHDALPGRRPRAEPIGVHALRSGTNAVGIGLPFGQTDAATFAALVDAAEAGGAEAFAPAEGRTLLALGLPHVGAASFRERAARLGFITRADDPRRAVVACPGAPACAAGLMPARAIAANIAAAAAPILDGSVILHVSGCAKGCAHPRAATLAFIGNQHGAGLVVSGRAGDEAVATVPAGDLPAAVARLAADVSAARRSGEQSVDTIARLGADRLASAITNEPAHA